MSSKLTVQGRRGAAGFSIIEAMVAAAILGGTALIITSYMGQAHTFKAQQERLSQAQALCDYVTQTMDCAQTIRSKSVIDQCIAGADDPVAIATYGTNGALISDAAGTRKIGVFKLQATCSGNYISYSYEGPADTSWISLSSGIPIFCPLQLAINWSQNGLYANIEDSHTYNEGHGGNTGNGPTQVFSGQTLNPGDVVTGTASGVFIWRIAPFIQGKANCDGTFPYPPWTTPDLHGWFLYFQNAGGHTIGNFSTNCQDRNYYITNYFTGVTIPPGARTAWIGFFDNAQSCDQTSYDDNEGNRWDPFGPSGGCNFSFQTNSLYY